MGKPERKNYRIKCPASGRVKNIAGGRCKPVATELMKAVGNKNETPIHDDVREIVLGIL
jgi:hypothetical protein